ncbi:hypothetical protein RI367_000039 [Sorochytrium milnesiophthora]
MSTDFVGRLHVHDKRHIAITRSADADAGFLLPLVFRSHAATSPILFFSTEQLFLHYVLICKKLGTSLAQVELFKFIDLLSGLHDDVGNASTSSSSSSEQVVRLRMPADNPGQLAVDMMDVARAFLQNAAAGGAIVVLDDLMPVVYAGLPAANAVRLVRNLVALCDQHRATLISVSSSALGYSDGALLMRTAVSLSDCMVVSRNLASGYSVDVHGQLLLLRGPRFRKQSSSSDVLAPVAMQYKVTDNGVSFFGRGLAANVV